MGIKVSTTCELTFGDKEPAVGWLVGDVHDGIAQMFKVIEYARMMVGTKAIATLSTGYLNALDYAKNRVQGGDLAAVRRTRTPPASRSPTTPTSAAALMMQKSYAEGMRALVHYTAWWQDQVELNLPAATAEVDLDLAERVNDLLLPIVKGVGSERVVRAAHAVAADPRRLGLPAGLPDRAVHPRLQDRHPLRGHHRDPGPGLVLPQDGPRPVPGAHPGRRRDPGLRQGRRRQRQARQGARDARQGARGRAGHRRHPRRLRDEVPAGHDRAVQGRPAHHPPAALPRRPRDRLAAAAPGRGRASTPSPATSRTRTATSTPARSLRRSSSRRSASRCSRPSAPSPRPPTTSSWMSTRPPSRRPRRPRATRRTQRARSRPRPDPTRVRPRSCPGRGRSQDAGSQTSRKSTTATSDRESGTAFGSTADAVAFQSSSSATISSFSRASSSA